MDIIADIFDKPVERRRNCYSYRIRNVDDIAMHLFHCLEDAMQELRRGACGVHGREKTGSAMIFNELHRVLGPGHDIIMAHLDSMSYLDVGCGNENMHHAHISVKAGLSIFSHNAREAADLGLQACFGDLPDAVKLAFGGYGKSSLDNIHAEFVQLPGDLELLLLSKGYARSLLAISKSCVKNGDSFINKRAIVVEDDSPQRFRVS
jgi:hypothetical protein